jgi:hypothetical protein
MPEMRHHRRQRTAQEKGETGMSEPVLITPRTLEMLLQRLTEVEMCELEKFAQELLRRRVDQPTRIGMAFAAIRRGTDFGNHGAMKPSLHIAARFAPLLLCVFLLWLLSVSLRHTAAALDIAGKWEGVAHDWQTAEESWERLAHEFKRVCSGNGGVPVAMRRTEP